MPTRPQDHRSLPAGDFRVERSYLADHVFAVVPGGDKPTIDMVKQRAWEGMMHLPTDVLLRTTDYLGTMVTDLHDQGSTWIFATPMEVDLAPFMFEPAFDASDEFQAAPFIAAHGWYRQATASLRNALEAMACGAAFAVRKDVTTYSAWRSGSHEPKFGNAIQLLGQDQQLAAIDRELGGSGLFGRKPDGVMQKMYSNLCRYAHSRAGHTNADMWQSNGPILRGRAFTQFWIDFGDTIALCYVLLKIGWPELALPDEAKSLYGFANERWGGIGDAVRDAFFVETL